MDLSRLTAFLSQELRPLSLNDIYSMGFKDIPKNTVKNSLDILVKKKKIILKENAYCINFENLPPVNQEADEVRQRIKKFIKKIKEKEDHNKYLEGMLNINNNKEMPLEVLENKLTEMIGQVDELKNKANEIKDRLDFQVSDADLHDLRKKYDLCLKEFNKRKVIGSTMLGQMLEVCPKTMKVLVDEAEVETDDMVGFNIADYPRSYESRFKVSET